MTNKMIIEAYKLENDIDPTCVLHTFAKWQSMGYKIKKGEKSKHHITIWRKCNKKVYDEESQTETISSKLILKTAYFFTVDQVEKVEK